MRISDWSSDVCASYLVERAAHQINLACHARCQRRAAERDVGLPFGFEPHAGDINLVAGPQMDVEAEQVEQAAAHRGEAVARNARAARGGLRRTPRSTGTSAAPSRTIRSEEHTSELQSLMRISYAVFCLKKKNNNPLSTLTQ